MFIFINSLLCLHLYIPCIQCCVYINPSEPPRRLLKLSIWSPNFKATNSNSTSNASQSSNDKINFNSSTPNSMEIHPHKVEVCEHWKNGKRNPAYNCSLFDCTCWRNGKRKTSGHGLENVNTCESSHIHQQIWKSTNMWKTWKCLFGFQFPALISHHGLFCSYIISVDGE